jgi:exonuclease III
VTENVHVESAGLEAMVYIIHFPKQSVLVITLYRPPAGNKLNFLQALESLLSKLSVKLQQYQVIVTGDFNMDQTGGNHKELRQLMAMHNMHQLISIPTHVQGGILDLIFTNVNDLSGDCFPVCYSDHFLVWTSVKKLASPV